MKVFAPELTEEASRIVDEAVKIAEIELLGWTNEEAAKAWGQACLGFDHGGLDMQPRSGDRYLLYLAAWLEAMDEDEGEDRPERFKISEGTGSEPTADGAEVDSACAFAATGSAPSSSPERPQLQIERITRKAVLEHPIFAPRLDEIYEKARLQNPTLPATLL